MSKYKFNVEYIHSAEFCEEENWLVTVGTTKNLLFSIAKTDPMNCKYLQFTYFVRVSDCGLARILHQMYSSSSRCEYAKKLGEFKRFKICNQS